MHVLGAHHGAPPPKRTNIRRFHVRLPRGQRPGPPDVRLAVPGTRIALYLSVFNGVLPNDTHSGLVLSHLVSLSLSLSLSLSQISQVCDGAASGRPFPLWVGLRAASPFLPLVLRKPPARCQL